MAEKSIVGDLINFRGLVYAPINENGVIFLFGKIADELNMYIEEIKPGFPDCIGRRFVGKGWERIAIEFEYKSSNFVAHGHAVDGCDMIICWEHDWKNCPLEVIELKSEIKEIENNPIKKPGATEKDENNQMELLDNLFKLANATPKVREWYEKLFDEVAEFNEEIWSKIGKVYIGWYSPEKAFVSISAQKAGLKIEVFSRGEPIEGTTVINSKHVPRWVKFTVKSDADISKAVEILKISYKRIKDAIDAGEPTGYFSGGEPFGEKNTEENNC